MESCELDDRGEYLHEYSDMYLNSKFYRLSFDINYPKSMLFLSKASNN